MEEISNTILTSKEGQIVKITKIDDNSYYPRFSIKIEISGQQSITLKCTDSLKEMIGVNLLHIRLEEESVADISKLDYSNKDEICPEEACEIPRFEFDFEKNELVETETGTVYNSAEFMEGEISKAIKKERTYIVDAIGRAMALQIANQDTTKYEEWSSDMSRFKKEYLEFKK